MRSTEALSELVEKASKTSIKTRLKRINTTKFHELLITTKKPKMQPATSQVGHRRSASSLSSRNRFVFDKDCVVCDKFQLRYKNKDRNEIWEYFLLLTFDAKAEALVKMLEKNKKYKEFWERTALVIGLIKTMINAGKKWQETIEILLLLDARQMDFKK